MVSHMKTQEFLFSAIAGLFHFPIIQSENTNIFPPLPPRRDTQTREWSKRKTGLENSTIQRKKPKPDIFPETKCQMSGQSLHLFWHYISCVAACHVMSSLFSFLLYFLFLHSAVAPCGFPRLQLWSVGGLSFCYPLLLLWHSVCCNLTIINLENKLALLEPPLWLNLHLTWRVTLCCSELS